MGSSNLVTLTILSNNSPPTTLQNTKGQHKKTQVGEKKNCQLNLHSGKKVTQTPNLLRPLI